MRSLRQSLQDHELTILRVLGEWWELDLTGADEAACVAALAETLADLDMQQELAYLPPEEAAAVNDLLSNNGRIPVASFSRKHGEVRMMGPGRLEREEPWFNPVSAAEALWYRGFLYRGFDETADGLMEFYFLPDELAAQLEPPSPSIPIAPQTPAEKKSEKQPLTLEDLPPSVFGAKRKPKRATLTKPEVKEEAEEVYAAADEVALVEETAVAEEPFALDDPPVAPPPEQGLTPLVKKPIAPQTADTDAVDDLTALLCHTQLSGLRGERPWAQLLLDDDADRVSLLLRLAREADFIRPLDGGGYRLTQAAVGWLRGNREEQLRVLMDGWSASQWNELRHVEELSCEGDSWENDSILPRTALLNALPRSGDWFRLDELVAYIKGVDPDFQRPDGNYDTWYIRDLQTSQYLTGFESWEWVEGRLLRYLIAYPMFWLGMVDLDGEDAFRLTPRALAWLNTESPAPDPLRAPLILQENGRLLAPRDAGRYQRFQAARIAEAEQVEAGKPFPYRFTPLSLAGAKAQGVDVERILRYLQEATQKPVPAGVKRALQRWAERGVEGRLETAVVLRVRDAEILTTLRNNPKTRDYLGESLGDFAAVVKGKDWQKLQAATTQLGLLLDYVINKDGDEFV